MNNGVCIELCAVIVSLFSFCFIVDARGRQLISCLKVFKFYRPSTYNICYSLLHYHNE